jgi:hypothetical protein
VSLTRLPLVLTIGGSTIVRGGLTGDGRQSILTARAQISTSLRNGSSHGHVSDSNAGVTSGITKSGELVWLENARQASHSIDSGTGTPLKVMEPSLIPLVP